MTERIRIAEIGTAGATGHPPAQATRAKLAAACALLLAATWLLDAGLASASPRDTPTGSQETATSTTQAEEEERMTTTTLTYDLYINASPQKVWDAITTSAWTERYGYQGRVEYDLEAGGAFRAYSTSGMVAMGMPEVAIDGEVIAAEPPHKLVQTYRFLFNEETKAEGFTRITWEIVDTGAGFCRLSITHELDGAPLMAGMVSSKFSETGTGGWSWILSDLKSLLESGQRLEES